MKSKIRSLVGAMLSVSGAVPRSLRSTGVVVAFHRVNDQTAGDELTRSPRDYDRFCRFFKAHFDVVPLAAMIDHMEAGDSIEGMLAITHDDGYLDNYREAAPILTGHGLPATFFVSTRFMESETVPHWDSELAQPQPWMSWDQVRSMRDAGFTIGSHTLHHADLGVVDGEEAEREIVDSRAELEAELGETVDLFAYPYGGEANLSEANRGRIERAGYRCCVSCHGGVTPDGTNRFRIPRVPIGMWYEQASQLAFDLGLGRA